MSDLQTLTIVEPDDWHLHLRDGSALGAVVAHTAMRCARAIVMPNLKPPVCTVEQALAYAARIRAALPEGMSFEPLMTLYLTDNTDPDEIDRAVSCAAVHAVKLYPAGATTNSDSGVTDLEGCSAVLERMEKLGLPLLVHGEVTDSTIDIFDREKVFIDEKLVPMMKDFPQLKVVFEHITTREAVDFVVQGPSHLGATITAHHLLMNRNHMLVGGIRPHLYCLPVLKRQEHQRALLDVATSGHPRFFTGTDSAPHSVETKESACGCAGAYTAHASIELYAEAFDAAGALDKLEAFMSFNGPDFYGLKRNEASITLVRESWTVEQSYPFGDSTIRPVRAGETIGWRLSRGRA